MMSGKIVSIVLCLGWLLTLFLGMLMLMVGAVLFVVGINNIFKCRFLFIGRNAVVQLLLRQIFL